MLLKKIILLILVYLMIYKPEMFFIPHSINLSFGLLGFLVYISRAKRNNNLVRQTKMNLYWIIKATMPIVFISIVSCVVNFSFDLEFVTYPITIACALFFSYLVAFLFYSVYKDLNPQILIGYILSCQLIYMVLAILMFVNPSVMSVLLSVLRMDASAELAFFKMEGIRLVCFGASFFTSGIINGFVLILLAFYVSVYKHSQVKLILLYLYYILIIIVGMMMARTTLIGAGISLCVLCYYWLKSGFKIVKTLVYIVIAISVLLVLVSRLSSDAKILIEQLSNFAFEFVLNYQKSGSVETASSNDLIEMYSTLPENLKTWLIGDGRWQGENGSYYMKVDVGYLRDIFYFGLIGLTTLIFFYVSSLKRVIIKNKILPQGNYLLFFSLLAYVLVLNLKGPADLFYYIVPFIFFRQNEYVR